MKATIATYTEKNGIQKIEEVVLKTSQDLYEKTHLVYIRDWLLKIQDLQRTVLL